MRSRPFPRVLMALLLAVAGACGSQADAAVDDDRPTIVVTTNILGDVVSRMVGDDARVAVVMPAGTDPHDFEASAQQVAEMRSADVLVTNGGGFESGLTDAIEAAEADVPTVHAVDLVETLPFGGHSHEEEEGHSDDEAAPSDDEAAPSDDEAAPSDEEGAHAEDEGGHSDEEEGHDHDNDGDDPHVFTDAERMADAAEGIAAYLAEEIPALVGDAATERAADVVADLRTLADDAEAALAAIPDERRVLVTNHDVFGYFAERYDFEVVGVVVTGGGTGGETSASELAALADVVRAEEVPAIFADVSAPSRLADALAAEVGGDVEVVELYSESLGEPGSGAATYDEMVRTNVERIADALS